MKVLERLALVLFSIIILVIAVTIGLVIMNVVELKTIYKFLEDVFTEQTSSRIILGACAIAIILAIKALFFPTTIKKRQEIKSGVLLENQDGRLLISKDTIENLTNSVVKSFDQAVDVQTKISLDVENNITVYVSLLVKEDSIIKELSSNMQNKIKDTIKRSTDLNVSQVNINIKDIENNKNNKNNIKPNNQTKIQPNNIKVNQKEVELKDENTKEEQKVESVE